MSTPEAKVKEKVKKLLKVHGAYYHCPVQNGMGSPTLDFIGCHRGFYYSVETKAGSGVPTERQKLTMHEIQKAGGRTFVVNEFTGMDELEWWLTEA